MNVLADVMKTIMNENGKVSSGDTNLSVGYYNANVREEGGLSNPQESN